MPPIPRRTLLGAALAAASGAAAARSVRRAPAPSYGAWKNGPSSRHDAFPIGVWLQNPARAPEFRRAGIDLYVGLWKGPTEEQLATLRRHGMRVICDQNDVGLRHRDDPVIAGWMHGDEPDNAQPLPGGGYGEAIHPDRIVADYERIRAADPTRPVLLNLGQGVANDEWRGRGPKRYDYRDYCRGADIVSFDVYPVAGIDRPDGENYLWYVPRGVDRLRAASGFGKPVWNCIECTRISNLEKKATPAQVRAQVWMALIHGSRGIIYFVHQFRPRFVEHALLEDPEMLAAVTALNRQLRALAPVLNGPTLEGVVTVSVREGDAPVDVLVKERGGDNYLFAAGMRNRPARAAFTLAAGPRDGTVEVIDEGRTLPLRAGRFEDAFAPHAVHLYRVSRG